MAAENSDIAVCKTVLTPVEKVSFQADMQWVCLDCQQLLQAMQHEDVEYVVEVFRETVKEVRGY